MKEGVVKVVRSASSVWANMYDADTGESKMLLNYKALNLNEIEEKS